MRSFLGTVRGPGPLLLATGVIALMATLSLLSATRITKRITTSCMSETAISRSTTRNESLPDQVAWTSRSPILYVHFHKSGGSFVCGTMRYAQNHTPTLGNLNLGNHNCNTPFSEPNANVPQWHTVQSCRHLLPYTLDESGTPFRRKVFIAVEVPFKEKMPCLGFRSFAIMRDPVKRVQSHMRVHKWTEERVKMDIDQKRPSLEQYYLTGYPVANSMVIRQLLGRERFRDMTPINVSDLALAKQIVDRFDAFVPLEYMTHPRVLAVLNETVPEYYEGFMRKIQRGDAHKAYSYECDQDFLALLEEENKYDIMLYQYMLGRLDISY